MKTTRFALAAWVVSLLAYPGATTRGADLEKPVLLYSRYFNAQGDSRYLPEGAFHDVIEGLRQDFTVRVDSEPLSRAKLSDVQLLLVVNPNDAAVGNNPPPHHVTARDVSMLRRFVRGGGGLIVMGNQENHNLETKDMNRLLGEFGLQFTNAYTDAKKLILPRSTPLIGGLRWAYYTGNRVTVAPAHPAKPRALVMNDLNQKPLKGERDQPGPLLAVAEPGRGRVVVVTDSGWVADWALHDEGVGGVAIHGQDNWEIFRRLADWAAHLPRMSVTTHEN